MKTWMICGVLTAIIMLAAAGGCNCPCKGKAACPVPPQVAQAQSPAAN